jgi:hypothetical protein
VHAKSAGGGAMAASASGRRLGSDGPVRADGCSGGFGSGRSWAEELRPRWAAGVEGGNNRLEDLLKRLVGQKLKGRTEEKVWGGKPDFRRFGLKAFMGQKGERFKEKD